MIDLLGGFAILYLLACLVPSAIAARVGSPLGAPAFVWMLVTGWTPYGWAAALLAIWLTRARSAH